jgi:hypothetical protein
MAILLINPLHIIDNPTLNPGYLPFPDCVCFNFGQLFFVWPGSSQFQQALFLGQYRFKCLSLPQT